jgi:hypothetical protein
MVSFYIRETEKDMRIVYKKGIILFFKIVLQVAVLDITWPDL